MREGDTMLNSEKFYSKTNSLKDTTFDFAGHVRTLVRNTELSRMQDKKSFKDGKKKLEDLHADIDVLTCDEKTIGLSTLFQTNFFRLFFRYCTGV